MPGGKLAGSAVAAVWVVHRARLRRHLARIACGGRIAQVALRPDFSASAVSNDRRLLVDAPPADVGGRLPCEIGILDLGRVLRLLRTGRSVEVFALQVSRRRRQVRLEHVQPARLVSFLTADPRLLPTRPSPRLLSAVRQVNLDSSAPLTREDVRAIRRLARSFVDKRKPTAGLTVQDGQAWRLTFEDFKGNSGVHQLTPEPAHSAFSGQLNFPVTVLDAVLQQVRRSAELGISVPHRLLSVRTADGFLYALPALASPSVDDPGAPRNTQATTNGGR